MLGRSNEEEASKSQEGNVRVQGWHPPLWVQERPSRQEQEAGCRYCVERSWYEQEEEASKEEVDG